MALEKELEHTERSCQSLFRDEGKFVLIHGENVVAIYGTYEDAIRKATPGSVCSRFS